MNGSHYRYRWLIVIAVALALTAVAGWFVHSVRIGDLEQLSRRSCQESNENKLALTVVLQEAVRTRRAVNDPDAEEFAKVYFAIIDRYLQPSNCE